MEAGPRSIRVLPELPPGSHAIPQSSTHVEDGAYSAANVSEERASEAIVSIRFALGFTITLATFHAAAAPDSVRARDWRPVHASERAFPVLPEPFWVRPEPGEDGGEPLWVQIDPATGAIVPRTEPAALRPPLQAEALEPMRLQMTPEGYLILKTRGRRSVTTLELAPDGRMHAGCTDVAHRHSAASESPIPAAEAQGDRP